jgi:anti-sigma regulatory factor (Ser/Thr protein kinase)
VVLYTDGLVERRGTPLSEGINQLAAVLHGVRSADAACRRALDQMVPIEGLGDDLAVLALTNVPIPEELQLELPADPQVLSGTRRVLRRWLRAQGAKDPLISELALAANEACANAIEHAYPPGPASFELNAQLLHDQEPAEIVITIRDTGQWREPRGESRGRGLTIIEGATDAVEINRTDHGTAVVMRRRMATR